jgi:hypothetical protein
VTTGLNLVDMGKLMQYLASENAESRTDNYLENNINASRAVMNTIRGETMPTINFG